MRDERLIPRLRGPRTGGAPTTTFSGRGAALGGSRPPRSVTTRGKLGKVRRVSCSLFGRSFVCSRSPRPSARRRRSRVPRAETRPLLPSSTRPRPIRRRTCLPPRAPKRPRKKVQFAHFRAEPRARSARARLTPYAAGARGGSRRARVHRSSVPPSSPTKARRAATASRTAAHAPTAIPPAPMRPPTRPTPRARAGNSRSKSSRASKRAPTRLRPTLARGTQQTLATDDFGRSHVPSVQALRDSPAPALRTMRSID